MTACRQAVTTGSAPSPSGPYSQAIVTDRLIFVSGQLGIHLEKGELADGIGEQTRRALENLVAILEACGSAADRIVKVTVFLRDIADFGDMNRVYSEFFKGTVPPARTCVAVTGLPRNARVEIEAVACR